MTRVACIICPSSSRRCATMPFMPACMWARIVWWCSRSKWAGEAPVLRERSAEERKRERVRRAVEAGVNAPGGAAVESTGERREGMRPSCPPPPRGAVAMEEEEEEEEEEAWPRW